MTADCQGQPEGHNMTNQGQIWRNHVETDEERDRQADHVLTDESHNINVIFRQLESVHELSVRQMKCIPRCIRRHKTKIGYQFEKPPTVRIFALVSNVMFQISSYKRRYCIDVNDTRYIDVTEQKSKRPIQYQPHFTKLFQILQNVIQKPNSNPTTHNIYYDFDPTWRVAFQQTDITNYVIVIYILWTIYECATR